MSLFDILLDPIGALLPKNLALLLDPNAMRLFTEISNSLFPKPQSPTVPPAVGQVYSVSSQQNVAAIGNPQTVVMGTVRRWPELRSQPWTEFVANDQVLHQWMRVSVGVVQVLDVLIGNAPLESFPNFQVQLRKPGESMDLFHPNVYTQPQVSGIDVVSGAARDNSYTGSFTFAPGGLVHRIDHGTGADGVFGGAYVGSSVGVSGTTSNDGTYALTGANPGAGTADVTSTLASETSAATVTWQSYDYRDSAIKSSKSVNLVFSHALSAIGCTPNMTYPNDLTIFQAGDHIVMNGAGAGANQYVDFTILSTSGDGNNFVVSPTPADGAGVSDVILLRRYHGPFEWCPPGAVANRIAIDLVFPQGLDFITDKGAELPMGVGFDLQWQQIDDLGIPQTGWTSFAPFTVTDQTRNPKRITLTFDLPSNMRGQVRFARTTHFIGDQSTDQTIDQVQWAGLKGFIVATGGEDHTVDPDSTTLAVSVRSSGGLASGSDKKINCLTQGCKQIWDSGSRTWSAETPTNSVVWAYCDALRGTYTAKDVAVPDSQIDLEGLAALDAQLAGEGIEFNGAFDTATTLLEALRTILRVAHATPRFDWLAGQYSYYRDVSAAPVQLFTDMNSDASGLGLTLRGENSPSGILVYYQEPSAWEQRQIGYPDAADGGAKPTIVDMRNGCTSRQTAYNEAFYEWRQLLYRNRKFKLKAEWEPAALRYGSRVLVQSAKRKWGQAAEIVSAAGRTLTVWPPLDWSTAGQHFVYLRAPDGTPGAKINCSRGGSDAELVLASDPDVEITGDSAGELRTLIAFGIAGNEPQIALAMGVSWQLAGNGGQQSALDMVLDDTRVYDSPGAAPPDPFLISGTAPILTVTGFVVDAGSLGFRATWNAVTDAVLYELEWKYSTDITWNTAFRGIATMANWAVPLDQSVNVRVRAYGPGGTIGAWTEVDLMLYTRPAWAGTRNPALAVNSTSAEHVAETRAVAINTLSPGDVVKGYIKATLAGTANTKSMRVCVDADTSNSLLATFGAAVTGAVQLRFRFMVAPSGNVHTSYTTADEGNTALWMAQAGNVTVDLVANAINLQTRAWVANGADSITIDSIEWELVRAMP